MTTTDIIVLFLVAITMVHVAESNISITDIQKRVNTLEANIKNLKLDIEPLSVKSKIQQVIADMMKSGDLTKLVHDIKQTEVEAMQRLNIQMKSALRHSVKKFETELHQLRHRPNNSIKRKMRCCEQLVQKFEMKLDQLKRQLNNSVKRIDTQEKENGNSIGGNIQPTAAVTSTPSTPTTTPRENETAQWTRENFSLLVANRSASSFFKVDLTSRAITQHRIQSGKITDVVYHPNTNRVIFSNGSVSAPGGIFSVSLDGSDTQNISSKKPWYMAIDSANTLLFGSIQSSQIMSLNLTTLKEEPFTAPRSRSIYQLAVHTVKQLLFMVDIAEDEVIRIVQMNYTGGDDTVIEESGGLWALTVDEANDILYFNDGADIKRCSLRTPRSSETLNLRRRGRVQRLHFFRNMLFIAALNSTSEIYIPENNSTLITIDTYFSKYTPVLCFIPKIGDHS